ncbi:hypothetical protein [Streptomyces sp. NPDC049879]|uniref:hypothetical protein n=1 Tax=Streptomyces sp. NPDC049879 TaxID=3365598 RepID=UPI0037988E30
MLRVRTTPPRPADVTAIVPRLAPLARTATRLHPRPGKPSPHDSSVGGSLLWPADEPWPHCAGPHKWDGVNDPVTPEGERQWRLHRAAAGEKADAPWPEGPVPLLPVAQLYVRDVPLLRPPGQAAADVLQVLWCPFDHPAEPRTALFWRSAAEVADVLDAPPEPPVIQFSGYLPEPCLLAPEEVTEYPHLMELDRELQRQLEDRKRWQAAGVVPDSSEAPYEKDFYRESYRGGLSLAPGWKAGGWTRWGLTDPMPRFCSTCGTGMDPLLTISSSEGDADEESWIPAEERARALTAIGSELTNPTMLSLARGYDLQLYACPASPDHPHLQLVQ